MKTAVMFEHRCIHVGFELVLLLFPNCQIHKTSHLLPTLDFKKTSHTQIENEKLRIENHINGTNEQSIVSMH